MKGHTVPWIDGVRESLADPERRRVYLQEAVRDLVSGDADDCAITLHLFFEATCGYEKAGAVIGLSPETLETALRDSASLTLKQFGLLIQFALQQDHLRVAADFLAVPESATSAVDRQAA